MITTLPGGELRVHLRRLPERQLSVLLCSGLPVPEGTTGHAHGDFETDLYIRAIGKRKWVLTRELIFVHPVEGRIVVPVGFVFDGYSIPMFMRAVYQNMEGREDSAAAVHDFLRRNWRLAGTTVYRCDVAFRDAMEALDVPRRTRYTKFVAVVVAGYINPPPGDGTGGPVVDQGASA